MNTGDQVWLEGKNLTVQGKWTLLLKWYRPFPIEAKIGKVAYCLTLPSSMKIHNVFHIDCCGWYWQALWLPVHQLGVGAWRGPLRLSWIGFGLIGLISLAPGVTSRWCTGVSFGTGQVCIKGDHMGVPNEYRLAVYCSVVWSHICWLLSHRSGGRVEWCGCSLELQPSKAHRSSSGLISISSHFMTSCDVSMMYTEHCLVVSILALVYPCSSIKECWLVP